MCSYFFIEDLRCPVKETALTPSSLASRFCWQGRRDSAEEVLLVVKSRASLLEDIIRLVRENHRYQVPEVVALPIVGGNPDYLRWLEEETS